MVPYLEVRSLSSANKTLGDLLSVGGWKTPQVVKKHHWKTPFGKPGGVKNPFREYFIKPFMNQSGCQWRDFVDVARVVGFANFKKGCEIGGSELKS